MIVALQLHFQIKNKYYNKLSERRGSSVLRPSLRSGFDLTRFAIPYFPGLPALSAGVPHWRVLHFPQGYFSSDSNGA